MTIYQVIIGPNAVAALGEGKEGGGGVFSKDLSSPFQIFIKKIFYLLYVI